VKKCLLALAALSAAGCQTIAEEGNRLRPGLAIAADALANELPPEIYAIGAERSLHKPYGRLAADILNTGFSGDIGISREGRIATFSSPRDDDDTIPAWPWASVTKQIVAVMVMQQVEAGAIDLDAAAQNYLPSLASDIDSPTIRQLLQHRSGLRNPDDSPVRADGWPSFYTDGPTGIDWCTADRTAPTEDWRYNNCDYIVLGAILEAVTGSDLNNLFQANIVGPAKLSNTWIFEPGVMGDYHGREAAYDARLARYGWSAGLAGPIFDLLQFDRALMSGSLLSKQSLDTLWESDPALGYMALGQWVFEAPLKGCDTPVKIVERRGGIGKYQVRNIILPERETALVLTTSDESVDLREIWTGEGVMYDAISAVACT